MENASKALVIAGSVLIALMIASLLYYAYQQWGTFEKAKQPKIDSERVAEVNKSYLSYEKTLYGSELVGLINKMHDFNESRTRQANYSNVTMDMEVKFTKNPDDSFLFRNGTYNLNTLYNNIKRAKEGIENMVGTGKNSEANLERLAKQGSALSASDLSGSSSGGQAFKKLCDQLGISDYNTALTNAKEYYKYIQFKRMKFKYKETKFDSATQIVNYMSYEQSQV